MMDVSHLIAVSSLFVSILALLIAWKAALASERSAEAATQTSEAAIKTARVAEDALSTSVDIFKREGVFELHNVWREIRLIDCAELITPDVVRAVNTLELTASLWNHDIVDRVILRQLYWNKFKLFYETLERCDSISPGLRVTCREMLADPVKKAYRELSELDIKEVEQSQVNRKE